MRSRTLALSVRKRTSICCECSSVRANHVSTCWVERIDRTHSYTVAQGAQQTLQRSLEQLNEDIRGHVSQKVTMDLHIEKMEELIEDLGAVIFLSRQDGHRYFDVLHIFCVSCCEWQVHVTYLDLDSLKCTCAHYDFWKSFLADHHI